VSEPTHILPLSFDAIAWERASQGHYHFVDDPRGLCQVFHPWEASDTGYALQDVVPLFWGYELTGDRRFLEKGVQVMEASILDETHQGMSFGLSRYWEMQDILYYFRLAREMAEVDQPNQ